MLRALVGVAAGCGRGSRRRTRRATRTCSSTASARRLDGALGHRAARPRRRARPRHRRRRQAHLGRGASAAWPRIEAYALPRLAIEGCALRATGRGARAPQRRRLCGAATWRRRARCRRTPRIALLAASPRSTRRIAASPRSSAPGQDVVVLGARPDARRPAASRRRRQARRRPAASERGAGAASAALAVPARRHPPHPDRLRPRAVPALPAAAVGDAAHARRAGGRSSGCRRRCWPVVGIVTAFTVAHSITLGAGGAEARVAAAGVHRAGDRGDDHAGGARQRAGRSFRCGASS